MLIFDKTYHGFEDAVDLQRDVCEMFDDVEMDGEWQGKLKVVVTYEPEPKGDV